MRKAVRYVAPDGTTRIGRLDGQTVVDAGEAGPSGFVPTPEAWALLESAAGPAHSLADVRLLHPVVPGSVLCIGTNYRGHAEETDHPIPEYPIVFAKLASAVIGPEQPIVIPVDEPKVDYEAEVALVIGAPTRRASGEAARAAIGGVTAFNDVSGRRAQLETGMGQYTRGKSFDSFGPLGPAIAHPDDLDLAALSVRLVLSGELMQDSSTEHLIYDAERLVAWLSAAATLQPGDVIATGTPEGVGHALDPPRYLREGDVVEVHVEGAGVLRNPVVAE